MLIWLIPTNIELFFVSSLKLSQYYAVSLYFSLGNPYKQLYRLILTLDFESSVKYVF